MKTVFSIGDTAKIHHISKQTLIYYDTIGLLKPYKVDPSNNYRYYSMDEFAVLDVILLLKDLGVPLKQIQDYLKNRTVSSSIDLFEQQRLRINEKIRSLKRTKDKITNKLAVFRDYAQEEFVFDIPFVHHFPLRHVIEMPMDQPGDLLQFNISIKKLMMYLRKQEIDFNYQLGSTTTLQNIKNGLPDINASIFTLVDKPMKDPFYKTIPAGDYVCIYFKGNYEDFSKPYQLLLSYIEEHGYTVKGPAYEFSISDMYTVSNSAEYVTEITLELVKENEDYEKVS